ncbi:unnamed protein product [Arabidopsis halleri]
MAGWPYIIDYQLGIESAIGTRTIPKNRVCVLCVTTEKTCNHIHVRNMVLTCV